MHLHTFAYVVRGSPLAWWREVSDPGCPQGDDPEGDALVGTSPDVPPQRMQAITFFVSLGTSYVQIARYQGRYFLRDGYHRAVALLRAGTTLVPAVVIDAPTFQYIVPTPGLFDHEVAFSDHAPALTDFWDDLVSADASQPAVRTVLRIQAQKFPVQG